MLHFCVFSFNRGRFLKHCLASIERHAPGHPIWIFDDNSDDEATQSVLHEASQQHRVIYPPHDELGKSKHGGLYGNMARAFAALPDGAIACFIQDDMQLVRPLNAEDLQAIDDYFAKNTDAAILHPAFLKASNRSRDIQSMTFFPELYCYRRKETGASAGVYYSDVNLFHVDRLRQKQWRFDHGEKHNESQAKKYFPAMGFMQNPFVMWLPNVSAYRGKTKTFGLRMAEQLCESGFYPIQDMSSEKVTELKSRDPKATLAIAEDFLELVNPGEIKAPWFFYPLEKRKILRHLDRIEIKFKRLLSLK
ncbi:glycosyltransferase family A protein [Pleionea litopenaei]|uniref:Glycosyltransferase family A protein n=1 Tax=Pleionea litopenaei TaxID=3070815 RepID=A0AA51RRV4_9GAMM|nr:glycosyltransferase family A protein [Pleionea sp. HL-JVS1]WMS86329.1 glycosyltransferase family A protein [Pleionea sp. HL-JVS1]